MIFYVQKYEHMIQAVRTDRGFPADSLRGWKRKATQDYEQFWGLRAACPIRGHAKDIAAQMAKYFGQLSEDYRLLRWQPIIKIWYRPFC